MAELTRGRVRRKDREVLDLANGVFPKHLSDALPGRGAALE